MSNSIQVFTAEAIATFALCFVGVLSIAAAGDSLVTVALAHGLTIAVMVAAVGSVSGAHINPAVTFGFVVTGRMKPATAVLYWGAQLVGAAVAGFLLLGILDGSVLASASAEGAKGLVAGGTPQLSGVEMLSGILLEAVATFFLVFVVFGTAVSERAPKSVFPFAIGLTVTLGIMAIGPMTGALNPARHFGPALASGMWENVAVYWIGPLLGGALGGAVQHFILMKQAPISSD